MSIREELPDADPPVVDGSDEPWSLPGAPRRAKPDWQFLCERERARAEAAEARADVLFKDVRRLRTALRKADGGKGTTTQQSKVSRDTRRLHKVLEESRTQKDTIKSLRAENRHLRSALKESEKQKGTIKTLSKRIEWLHERLGTYRNQSYDVRVLSRLVNTLSEDASWLRTSLKTSEDERKRLLSRVGTLERQLVRLRATGVVLSKALYGCKSEQQQKAPSERKRGQQPGAAGHGRTQRPALEERAEQHDPPADERACRQCGQAYARNGDRVTEIAEIEVKAYKRVVNRSRWRRSCTCESSPPEVSAPPVPRLFPNTPYGTTVWSRLLFERYDCMRPLNRISAWMSDQGLPIAAGTMANSVPRFLPMFETLHDAILDHQNRATVRHGDETTWRVQALREKGRSTRAWLWTSVSADAVYFHIDPSRSAEAAHKLFAPAVLCTVIVCDRFSAYKKLARLLGSLVILAWCWAHIRRDFINCAAGDTRLTEWREEWIERIAALYRLNEARLAHYDPRLERQTAEFEAAQATLKEAADGLFANAERELAELPDGAREAKPLRSLVNHREGLCVFLDKPQVPMDNNIAERALRGPVIGRLLSFGSDSENGALLTARMYSIIGTLKMNGIDVLRWLEEWLETCAANGGRPPEDLSPWLPWSMGEKRKRALSIAPG